MGYCFSCQTIVTPDLTCEQWIGRHFLRMDNFFVNLLIKWNFRPVEHLSFINGCVSFVTGFSEAMKCLWILMRRLSHTKKVVSCEILFLQLLHHFKIKRTIFLWSNRERSTDISRSYLLQNPAVCLHTSHSEMRVKGNSLRSLSAKWRALVMCLWFANPVQVLYE